MISKLNWNNKNVKYVHISWDVLMWRYTVNGDIRHEYWGTALRAGRSWVQFPMVSLDFFIDIILPAALRPWGRLSL